MNLKLGGSLIINIETSGRKASEDVKLLVFSTYLTGGLLYPAVQAFLVSSDGPEIGIVLKALNHPLRREILLFLSDRHRAKFTDMHDNVTERVKSTGQFSYHLNLLVEAQILHKSDDTYTLTALGEKATAMIQLINVEVNTSIAQKISSSFSQLSPVEKVSVAWIILPILVFGTVLSNGISLSLSPMGTVLINVLSVIALVATTLYAYSRLQYIPSLLTLSSVVWILFLEKDHLTFLAIYLLMGFGGVLTLTGLLVDFNLLQTVTGVVMTIVGTGISVRYVLRQNRRGVHIRIS